MEFTLSDGVGAVRPTWNIMQFRQGRDQVSKWIHIMQFRHGRDQVSELIQIMQLRHGRDQVNKWIQITMHKVKYKDKAPRWDAEDIQRKQITNDCRHTKTSDHQRGQVAQGLGTRVYVEDKRRQQPAKVREALRSDSTNREGSAYKPTSCARRAFCKGRNRCQ